jgi:hypothetical protein
VKAFGDFRPIPWLAAGISRSTRVKARKEAALAAREAVLDRLAWQVAELQASLDKAASFHATMKTVLDAPLPLIW